MSEQPTGAGGNAVPLDIGERLAVMGGPEVLDVTISNVPAGAVLSAGTDNGDGTWSLTPADLDGLSLMPPAGWTGEMGLAVSAHTQSAGGDSGPSTTAFGYTVPFSSDEGPPPPVAGPEAAAPAPADQEPAETPDEGLSIALDIDTGLADAAAPETLRAVISGMPEGASLSAGVDNGGGNWFLTAADLEGLVLRLPAHAIDPFTLVVAVTEGGEVVATGSLPVDPGERPPLEPGPGVSLDAGPLDQTADRPADRTAGIAPIAYWKLDETSPGTAGDQMGNHDGLTSGSRDGDGAFEAVARFDGIDDHIEVPHTADFMLVSGTLTLWFNAFAVGMGTLAAKGGAEDAAAGGFWFGFREGRLQFRMQSQDDTHAADGGAFGANEWNQTTVTWGPGGMKAYLNGQLAGSDAHTGTLAGNKGPWMFGAADGHYFHGELDDIAIYDIELNADEVRELCQNGVESMMTGERPADMDSALDLDAIPSQAEGPESLATLDAPLGEQAESGVTASQGGPEPPAEPPPDSPGEGAITIAEGDELTLEGAEKLEW